MDSLFGGFASKLSGVHQSGSSPIDFGRAQFAQRVIFHTVNLRPISFLDAAGIRNLEFTRVNWVPEGKLNKTPEGIAKADLNQELIVIKKAIERRAQLLQKGESNPHKTGTRLRDEERRRRENEAGELERLAKTYRDLAINQEEHRRYQDASEFNYRSLDIERRKGRQRRYRKGLLYAHWLFSGYWERPWRALLMLGVIWLVFTLFYLYRGIPPGNPQEQGTVPEQGSVYIEAPIYSLGNMTLQTPAPKPSDTNGALQFLVVVFQRILGPVQTGFLVLSLRRQFLR